MPNGRPTRDELLEELWLAQSEYQVVLKEITARLARVEEKITCSKIALYLDGISTSNAHEIWAAAQLLPGEGVEDGVRRIKGILSYE